MYYIFRLLHRLLSHYYYYQANKFKLLLKLQSQFNKTLILKNQKARFYFMAIKFYAIEIFWDCQFF